MKKTSTPRVAYFSMEIALEPDIPTYSGGLGILAGDTLRSATPSDCARPTRGDADKRRSEDDARRRRHTTPQPRGGGTRETRLCDHDDE